MASLPNVPDEHFVQGHYGFMAAFAFTVIGVGLLASVRPDGWRLTAWAAGLLSALLGVTSLVYPDASSSLDVAWALATIAWGAVFVAAAEVTKNAEGRTLLGSVGDPGDAPASPSRRRPTSSQGDGLVP